MCLCVITGISGPDPEDEQWLTEARLCQKEFETIYWEWKRFDSDHLEYVKSTIGLIFFGTADVENPPPIASYYTVYNETVRNIIEEVFEKVRNECCGRTVKLSCTFLVCKLGDRIILYPLIRCTSPDLRHSVRFFDITATCYKSWDDFVRFNRLPVCKYFAPSSGVYFHRHTHYQTFTAFSYSGTVMTASPPTLIPEPFATAVYSFTEFVFGPRYRAFRPRRNRAWRLMQPPIIINPANVASVACNVLSHSKLVDFSDKVVFKEASYRDVFDFTLHIFQVCGAVVEAQDMHTALYQSSEAGFVNKKLTCTQKRNLRRRRAEMRLLGDPMNSRTGLVDIRTADVFTSAKSLALRAGSVGVHLLLLLYPKSEIIFEYFADIRNLMYRHHCGRVDINKVCQQLYYHVDNLNSMLEIDRDRMKSILRRFIPSLAVSDNDDIVQICNNEVDRMYQASEDIPIAVFGAFGPVGAFNPETTDSNPGSVDETEINWETSRRLQNQKLILDAVERTCSKYATDNSCETILHYFISVLMFVTRELVERITSCYDQLLNDNSLIVGEKKAKMMVSALGTKTADDFFPTNELFDQVMHEIEPKVERFASTFPGRCSSRDNSELATLVYYNLVTSVNDLFSKVTVTENVGIEQMAKTLQNVSVEFVNTLADRIQKMKTDADILYQENMDTLGCDEVVKEMLMSIDVPMEELDIFRTAVNRLDINDIVVGILEKSDHKYEKLVVSEVVNTENEVDESVEAMFIDIIAKLFHKVEVSRVADCWSTSEVFRKVVHFTAFKFIEEFKSDKECFEQLKGNLDIVRPQIFEQMLHAAGFLGDEKAELFREKARIFDDEDCLNQMVSEFIEYYCKNIIDSYHPKIYDSVISEAGFTAFKINCVSTESDQYYRLLVSTLFKIQVQTLDVAVKCEQCVLVKSDNVVVIFNFLEATNTALVILVPLNDNI